ncbi:MAG: hypothetical protein IH830_03145 [Planctomycetes bacterium]|nr:hypothetical protein [Planctomycetota bacterium]
MSTGCVDKCVLGRYWTPDLTAAVLEHSSTGHVRRYAFDLWPIVFQEILGDETWNNYCFEVECAHGYFSTYQTPFWIHGAGNALTYLCDEIIASGCAPAFPTEPPFDPETARFDPYPSWEDLYPDDFIPSSALLPETRAEQAVDKCDHSDLGRSRNWSLGSDFLGRGVIFRFLAGHSPTCKKCRAVILCACISADLRAHLGRSHSVLDKRSGQKRRRQGRQCLGFRDSLCELCRQNPGPVPSDTRFYFHPVAFMRAVRELKSKEPNVYQALIEINVEVVKRQEQAKRARLFEQILAGEDVHSLSLNTRSVAGQADHEEIFKSYHREARNLIREAYGLARMGEEWVSEKKLLGIIRAIFPNERIRHRYRPTWLEGLELDIYLPDRALAFEYMGLQHYQPVKFFGGAEAFPPLVERDNRKRQLCAERGVRVVGVRYDEPLTKSAVAAKYKRSVS